MFTAVKVSRTATRTLSRQQLQPVQGPLADSLLQNGPLVLEEPSMLSPQSDLVEYQAGAFFTEAEAKKILDVLRGERRSEPMVINMVPVFRTAEEWHENR